MTLMERSEQMARFRATYGAHRAAEGRMYTPEELLELPYLTTGRFAKQWAVKARSYDAFVHRILTPLAQQCARPLHILDLGAGNGWLAYRAVALGHQAVALDLRDDTIDGLGAARPYLQHPSYTFHRVAGTFDQLPLDDAQFDVVVFNAALHYALDLYTVLHEAARVARSGGRVVILDSPFYGSERDGNAMVTEKHATAAQQFGDRRETLLVLPFIEFLTKDRLANATADLGWEWQRHRVHYPLWYERRPVIAWLAGRRAPSRFDVWEGVVT